MGKKISISVADQSNSLDFLIQKSYTMYWLREPVMNTFISLLRGINVSGQNRIRMPDLRDLYYSLSLVNVETYVQSGNVVFDCAEKEATQLAKIIEAEIARSLGLSVKVILRNKGWFKQIIDRNPFVIQRNEDPEKLHVTFLSEIPSELALSKLPTPASTTDEFRISGLEIYLFCPNGYGRTKLSNTFFERKLNVSATTRNWKTVNALHEMANQR
jgi:uncharacterized protein (DUF1697 family)